ncbi:hypothetical protein Goari_019581 [Gossypium aridum]|uniref:Uncharacterized protein n=1 Tax=Gossypium aridum TaxID=34290 RepID=A0A7J8WT36_GOSAI|nr:hypothetical protein [Gossypium aridum]
MSELPANSKEENSRQEQQQCSNANNRPRPNLNVLLPQPRFPVNSDGEYETDEYFGDEDSEGPKQEELVDEDHAAGILGLCIGGLDNMLTRFILQPNQIYYLPFI